MPISGRPSAKSDRPAVNARRAKPYGAGAGGHTALLFRLARAWDNRTDSQEAAWARLFTPAAKYSVCKAGIPFVAEAMEVLGGAGYCEESELPRLYREMPVNSIWEGSGNIMCPDVLRVLAKQSAFSTCSPMISRR